MITPIRIAGVCERDIDLLLFEEFVASARFRSWFLSLLGLQESVELVSVERSVTTQNGESDLEVTMSRSDAVIKLLIENKVDAVFQPQQPERYRERVAAYQQQGRCSEVYTVVIAPAIYFGHGDQSDHFDFRVTYEGSIR